MNNNNKSNISSITDLILTQLLMEGFWEQQHFHRHQQHPQQQNKNNDSNKYISDITDPISTKLEIITKTTETTTMITKIKTTTHSTTTTNNNKNNNFLGL